MGSEESSEKHAIEKPLTDKEKLDDALSQSYIIVGFLAVIFDFPFLKQQDTPCEHLCSFYKNVAFSPVSCRAHREIQDGCPVEQTWCKKGCRDV
jgi:hypothetical protein